MKFFIQMSKNKSYIILRKIKGMTLLEVIIAMALFGMIAFSLMRMTDASIKYRQKIAGRMKQVRLSRLVTQVIRKDFHNMFSADDVNAILILSHSRAHGANTGPSGIPGASPGFFVDWTPPSPLGIGGLMGDESRVTAISFSEEQLRADELVTGGGYRVFYYLKPCRSQEDTQNVNCLWRSVSSDILPLSGRWDMDLGNKKNEGRVLLKNVKTFQISYLNIFDGQWKKQWPIVSQKDIFLPAAIKVFLEFQDRKKRWVQENLIIPIYQRYLSLRIARS